MTWTGRPFALVLALLVAGAGELVAQEPAAPRILVLGSYHMANPKADDTNVEADDVTRPRRQAEIEAVVAALAAFEPTKIGVELTPDRQDDLDTWYRMYLDGDSLPIPTSELDQIAFRLAARTGHDRVYAIDHAQELDIDGVVEAARASGHGELVERARSFTGEATAEFQRIQAEGTVGDLLRFLNSPAVDRTHRFYYAFAPVRRDSIYVGARMVANWYERNLAIFANVHDLIEGPDERILIVIGAGHGTLLREFVEGFPGTESVPAGDFLPVDAEP